MTDFIAQGNLPDEYADLAKGVRDFAQRVVAPVSAQHDKDHTFPYEVVSGMAEMGLFGIPFPEEFGGMGGDYFALCLALEELAKVDQSVAITLEAGVGLGAMPIYRFGSQEQKEQWLPMLASGEALGGFGLTEAGAGSDASGTRTTAKEDGDEWVINGSKQFITNSGTDITKLVTVTAVTGESQTADGRAKKEISTIIVPANTPGFTAEPAYDKVGWNASDTHPLSFSDVRVPKANLLGERGRGYANFLRILDEGRIAIAALAVGAEVTAVDAAARDVVVAAGHGEHFTHGLGHGVGLEIHEAPGISALGAGTLAAGMAVTVEPGVYLPGHGGVRIEDTLIVTAGEPELLTLTSKELLVL